MRVDFKTFLKQWCCKPTSHCSLKTYPDQLKEKISGFDQYLEFVDEEFFQSISDFLLSTKEEDIDDEIRQHFEQDQATNLSTDFSTFSEKVDSKISTISEENEANIQNIQKLLDSKILHSQRLKNFQNQSTVFMLLLRISKTK